MFDVLKRSSWVANTGHAAFDWSAKRKPELHKDAGLNGTTRRWLQQLPGRRKPYRLCTLYPRVANRLAWSWPQVDMAEALLEELLADRRGGRKGFPSCVVRELHRLREFNQQQRREIRPEGFSETAARLLLSL
jgi:hypothetical protein